MDMLGELTNPKKMTTVELLSEVALLAYLGGNEMGTQGLKFLTGAKIAGEVYRRLTEKEKLIDGLRAEAIQNIAFFVQNNPNSSTDQQAKEIKKHIDDFAVKVAVVYASH